MRPVRGLLGRGGIRARGARPSEEPYRALLAAELCASSELWKPTLADYVTEFCFLHGFYARVSREADPQKIRAQASGEALPVAGI